MDALEPFPSFKSVIGLEVPSGERCHNDTALLHNSAQGPRHPHSVHVGAVDEEHPWVSQMCENGNTGQGRTTERSRQMFVLIQKQRERR